MLMLDTAAADDVRKKILSDVESAISGSGEIIGTQDWGARAMTYEIRHKTDAEYHLLQFHGPRELLSSLDRTLRITDGVVRFRIIKLAPGTPAPPEVPAAPPRPAEAAPEASAPAPSAPESAPEPSVPEASAPADVAPSPTEDEAEPVAAAAGVPADGDDA
jgi:small subunit ribosomal protein S6